MSKQRLPNLNVFKFQLQCVEMLLALCSLDLTNFPLPSRPSDYLGNVLDDLGLRLAEPLHALSTLLRCPAAEYGRISGGGAAAGQPTLPPRLVAAVRHMRGLVSES